MTEGGPTVYEAAGGAEGMLALARAWHARCLAVACFDLALTDVGITEGRLRAALHGYFAHGTDRMAAHPDSADDIPDGLAVPRWDWRGPVGGA